MTPIKITEKHAKKIVELLSHGLCAGIGTPEPGKMCVEAAVCAALGLPHGDEPPCVATSLRALKITINDTNWSSNAARADGLKRLALIQLGSAGALNDIEFAQAVSLLAKTYAARAAEYAAECAASAAKCAESAKYAAECAAYTAECAAKCAAKCGAESAKYAKYAAECAAESAMYAKYAAKYGAESAECAAECAASAAMYAKYAARCGAESAKYAAKCGAYTDDQVLVDFCEDVVQILIKMDVPGVQWLPLAGP